MDIIFNFFNSFAGEAIIKMLVISLLAGIIGLERESLSKPAGFKTHLLLGISSVLVVLCSEYIFSDLGGDPTRIPAQLLSGIGFIGAGSILRDGFSIKGLTTAASLLTVTCIGLCVGVGFYFAAVFATVIVYCILAYARGISEKFDRYNVMNIIIKSKNIKKDLKDIKDVLEVYNFETETINIIDEEKLEIKGGAKENFDKSKVSYKIMQVENVTFVEAKELDDDDNK